MKPIAWYDTSNGCVYTRIDDAVHARMSGNRIAPLYRPREERALALREAAKVCEQEADAIERRFPDAKGGKWAKLLARRALLGAAGLIDQLRQAPADAAPPAPSAQPSLPRDTSRLA